MFYNVVQCLNFTFQMMLHIDKSALLYKLTFIIKKIMKWPLWRLQINCLFRKKVKAETFGKTTSGPFL